MFNFKMYDDVIRHMGKMYKNQVIVMVNEKAFQ